MCTLLVTTTPPPTTTAPVDCIYAATPEELEQDEPVEYDGDITADINPDGQIVYDFKDDEPRDVTNIKIDVPDTEDGEDTPLEAVPIKPDGTEGTPIPLVQGDNPINPAGNPDFDDVDKVIIRNKDQSPLQPDDIPSVEVVACIEGNIHYSISRLKESLPSIESCHGYILHMLARDLYIYPLYHKEINLILSLVVYKPYVCS